MIRQLFCVALLGVFAVPATGAAPRQLPELPHQRPDDWINSMPITASSLHGHPLLIEFWTFDCSNCLASQPWMRAVAARYRSEGLAVIGVHTPELPHEHDPRAVRAAVRRLGIDYPVMLDGDYAFWGMLGNRYWPAFYLFDAQGRLVAVQIGELHRGEARGDAFERLLAETLRPPVPTNAAP
jgi:thiol-disulfide isomerase/thioredoxin